MQETDLNWNIHQRAYEHIVEELRRAGFTGVSFLAILQVHQDMVHGKGQTDIIGRTIEGLLRDVLGL